MDYISTVFDVDSLSRFPFRTRTDGQTDKLTYLSDRPTHVTATAGVGDEVIITHADYFSCPAPPPPPRREGCKVLFLLRSCERSQSLWQNLLPCCACDLCLETRP